MVDAARPLLLRRGEDVQMRLRDLKNPNLHENHHHHGLSFERRRPLRTRANMPTRLALSRLRDRALHRVRPLDLLPPRGRLKRPWMTLLQVDPGLLLSRENGKSRHPLLLRVAVLLTLHLRLRLEQ